MKTFFLQFSRQIQRSLELRGVDVSGLPVPETSPGSASALGFYSSFLPPLRRALGDRSLVLCLDEFEELENKVQRGRLEIAVFEFLCELMQTEEQIACVLAGTRHLDDLGATCQQAASIVDMVVYRRIGVLPPHLTRRLIEEPVSYSGMRYQEEAIQRLQQATGGHPYLTQLLCGASVNRRNEYRRNEVTLDDIDAVIATTVEGPQPGFFWATLRPQQQAVLIAVCWLAHSGESITPTTTEAQLETYGLSSRHWPAPVEQLLHELALEELLQEQAVGGKSSHYVLASDLSGVWVRRHKAIDQIRKDIGYER
jgi:hypothetical protein